MIDVGRAKRTAQPAQWRALKARHQTCAAPGCERPLGWTQAHEGGWQVVTAGERVEFIPPESPVMLRRRWGEERWAA